MLQALRRPELLSGCGGRDVSRILKRTYRVPRKVREWKPKEHLYVSEEAARLSGIRDDIISNRLVQAEELAITSRRLVETSRVRRLLRRTAKAPVLTIVLVFGMGVGIIAIWVMWSRDNSKVDKVRERALSLDLPDEDAIKERELSERRLPRPLVIVGRNSAQKTEFISSLLAGREDQFGLPVYHTTRGPRHKEEEGTAFYFAPQQALEQGVYAGAFVSHGYISVGDKTVYYGLSKGAVADVQVSGRVCLLDLEPEHVESISKTDLQPLIVLVSERTAPSSAANAGKDAEAVEAAVAASKEWGEAVSEARKKKLFHLEVSLEGSPASLDSARNAVVDLLADQLAIAGAPKERPAESVEAAAA